MKEQGKQKKEESKGERTMRREQRLEESKGERTRKIEQRLEEKKGGRTKNRTRTKKSRE